ncbi:hypothetical protein TEQG_01041 [Trichophyton equinum CBS 127.97]|uniref:Uncharacterized protein n=1 Tax=Trichophyton equinum (strain ATCC MYA-4606 / CBS 127.97) TaxID=559882 RepID=F2PJD4_TRIEC|nr:hypothetical protein TEQG_01041 [Trichophyton equinum CBS 127.97]
MDRVAGWAGRQDEEARTVGGKEDGGRPRHLNSRDKARQDSKAAFLLYVLLEKDPIRATAPSQAEPRAAKDGQGRAKGMGCQGSLPREDQQAKVPRFDAKGAKGCASRLETPEVSR